MSAAPKYQPRPPAVRMIDLGGRVPPHNAEAEAAVLSAILSDGRKLDRVGDQIAAGDFYSDANRRIFEVAVELHRKGTPVDVQTVGAGLKDRDWLQGIGGISYLTHILDSTAAVAHVEAYAKVVREKARVRALIEALQLRAAEAFGDIGDTETFLQEVEAQIFELTRAPGAQQVFELRNLVAAEEDRLTRIDAGERAPLGLSTGLTRLDDVLTDLRPKEITVVAGRPGQGKTSLATDVTFSIASTLVEGVQQGIFFGSIEMPKEALTRKMASQRAFVSVKKINKGDLTDRERELIREANAKLEKLHVVVDDVSNMTPMRLRAQIRRAQAAFDVPGRRRMSCFVVDYVQRMKPDVPQQTREREVGSCMTALAEIAKETGMHGIVLAQLNREVEARGNKDLRPRMRDLRDSGQIEQDAHNIIFVHRPEYYVPKDEVRPEDRGRAEAIIAKQREGETGVVDLKFHGFCTRFTDA